MHRQAPLREDSIDHDSLVAIAGIESEITVFAEHSGADGAVRFLQIAEVDKAAAVTRARFVCLQLIQADHTVRAGPDGVKAVRSETAA
jgi:hypothetical protein